VERKDLTYEKKKKKVIQFRFWTKGKKILVQNQHKTKCCTVTEEDSSNAFTSHKILSSLEDHVLHAFRLAVEKFCETFLK
jgi:type IV secretory pathway VirD2 relaxase